MCAPSLEVSIIITKENTPSLECACHKIFRILKVYMGLRGKIDKVMDEKNLSIVIINRLDLEVFVPQTVRV